MKLAKAVCACAVVLMTVVPVAQAEEKLSFIESLKDQPSVRKIFNEMHSSLCACIAYNMIATHGLKESNADPKAIEHVEKIPAVLW